MQTALGPYDDFYMFLESIAFLSPMTPLSYIPNHLNKCKEACRREWLKESKGTRRKIGNILQEKRKARGRQEGWE